MNISTYIATLDSDVRSQLYTSPWTCQALFRALAPLAQQYVIRLLYVDQPVPEGGAHRAPCMQPWHAPACRLRAMDGQHVRDP